MGGIRLSLGAVRFPMICTLLLLALPGGPAFAQNLVTNGQFDASATGWTIDVGSSFDRDGTEDEGGCAGSGAGVGLSGVGQMGLEQVRVLQCVHVTGGETAYLRFRHKGEGIVTFRLQTFQATSCGGQANTAFHSGDFPQSADSWSTATGAISVSADSQSLEIRILASNATPHTFYLDGVELRYLDSIFVDDFEGNEGGETAPCRWITP